MKHIISNGYGYVEFKCPKTDYTINTCTMWKTNETIPIKYCPACGEELTKENIDNRCKQIEIDYGD
jgi:hypothetical protein